MTTLSETFYNRDKGTRIPLDTFYSKNTQKLKTIRMANSDSLEVTVNVKVEAPAGQYICQVPCGVHYHKGDDVEITEATYVYKVTLEPVACYLGNDTDPELIQMDTDATPPSVPVKVKHIEELGETLKLDEPNW